MGPITVEVDGHASRLGGHRQRIVLAVLLSRANQVVAQDTLIDAVWSGEPPEAARATLQSYIYNLRRATKSDLILRRGDGYLIEADAGSFDVLDFTAKLEQGRSLLATNPGAAREELADALGLWYGAPYGGVDHLELHSEIQRLDEMRVNAVEARIQADLALGRDGELVGELDALVREYPLRERFWGQLMLALYRSGRQAEALRTFQQARARLVDELGIEPGAELQELEDRILAQDPSLLPDRSSNPHKMDAGSLRGYELREVLASTALGVAYRAYQHSVGREVVVKSIRPEFANDTAFVARFEKEAQTVAALGHPHILPLHDYWRDPSGAYLVVPFMAGGSLAHSLRAQHWHLEPAMRLLDQIGGALGHAHRRGVIHGHLTASSVVLDDEGNAYLGDFGIGLAPDGGLPTVLTDVEALGRLALHLLTGEPPRGQPDTTGLPAGFGEVVARAVAASPGRYSRVSDFLRDLRRAAGMDVSTGSDLVEPRGEPIRNPYKGLRAFTEMDAADFHGRAELVGHLLQTISEQRLVTIVGPSGSGKSSVVRAGVVPSLRAGALAGSQDWLITDMFPGSYPFEELEAALRRVSVRGADDIMSELTAPTGLLRVCKRILPEDSMLLLIIDQFEELFSLVRSEEVRRTFIDNLIAVADDERGRIRVVTTIRADFLDRPLSYGDFAAAIAPGLVTVGPPARDGLAQSIAAPARAVGLELEPGLVTQVVADVEGQPGALPLLQYALTETFAAREGGTLTFAAYESTGGVAGAIGRRAEELYQDLSPVAREVAREVFLRLVAVDEVGVVTRKRARQNDLTSLAVDRAALQKVLDAYARFRLISFDRDPVTRGPTVEVAHEALLTTWPRLETWIDDARETLVMARRVGESAHDWVASDKDPSYLLRGSRLDDIERWSAGPGVILTGDEEDFITASVITRNEEIAAGRRRRRRALTTLSVGMVLVSLFAILAFFQRQAARREATLSISRELAGASRQLANPELALLVAMEAFDTSIRDGAEPTQEAVSALAHAMFDWRLITRYPAAGRLGPMSSPDGSRVAAQSVDNPRNVVVFDAGGSPLSELVGPDLEGIQADSTAFHPDGELIAVAYTIEGARTYSAVPEGEPDVILFRASTGAEVARIDLVPIPDQPLDNGTGAFPVSFSASGRLLALSGGTEVAVVDWARGEEITRIRFAGPTGPATFLGEDTLFVPVASRGWTWYSISEAREIGAVDVPGMTDIAAADPAGRRLAHRVGERVEVLDAMTNEVLISVEDPGILALAVSPDGARFAYSGYDSTIHVIDLEGGRPEILLEGALSNVISITFVGPDRLLTNGENPLMWDVSMGSEAFGFASLSRPQWGFQVSPDERWLAYMVSASTGLPIFDPGDGVRLIDLASHDEVLAIEGELQSVPIGLRMVSPDFTLFGSLREDMSSSLRLLPSWDPVVEFERCRAALAFSPDSTRVLLSGSLCPEEPDGAPNTELIDLETGETVLTLPYSYTFSAELNPEGTFEAGRYLVATDQDTVGVWDTHTGEQLVALDPPPSWEYVLVVSFDSSGRRIVGGTTAGTVWVLDLAAVVEGATTDEALVFTRQAHSGATPAPAVGPQGIVASPGFDGLIRIWDVDTGALLFEYEADMTTPYVRFSTDGSRLFYPHGLSIRQMPVDPYELRALAGELVTRDFLPDECERYSRDPCEQG